MWPQSCIECKRATSLARAHAFELAVDLTQRLVLTLPLDFKAVLDECAQLRKKFGVWLAVLYFVPTESYTGSKDLPKSDIRKGRGSVARGSTVSRAHGAGAVSWFLALRLHRASAAARPALATCDQHAAVAANVARAKNKAAKAQTQKKAKGEAALAGLGWADPAKVEGKPRPHFYAPEAVWERAALAPLLRDKKQAVEGLLGVVRSTKSTERHGWLAWARAGKQSKLSRPIALAVESSHVARAPGVRRAARAVKARCRSCPPCFPSRPGSALMMPTTALEPCHP